jgi:hydrogenase maturation protein HypF
MWPHVWPSGASNQKFWVLPGTGQGMAMTVLFGGGEFLLTDLLNCRRFAHLNLFALPGGEQAIKEPRRSALGLLFSLCDGHWEEYNDLPCVKAFNSQELHIIQQMIKQKINSPLTSSMGRLFDGIASLIGLCHHVSFEGQAAMALEYQISDKYILDPYYFDIVPKDYKNNVRSIDWTSIIKGVIEDLRAGRDAMVISTRFHLTLIKMIIDMAYQANKSDIVLTGGCFQNKWLIENAVRCLKQEGFNPYWNTQVPANDGGISLGQMFVAANHKWH